jgi:hypothetical protein
MKADGKQSDPISDPFLVRASNPPFAIPERPALLRKLFAVLLESIRTGCSMALDSGLSRPNQSDFL